MHSEPSERQRLQSGEQQSTARCAERSAVRAGARGRVPAGRAGGPIARLGAGGRSDRPARSEDPEEASVVHFLERYEEHEQHDDDGEHDAHAAAPARWRLRGELRRHERGGDKFGGRSCLCISRLLGRRGILVSLQVFRTRLVQHARLLDAAHLARTRRAVQLDLVDSGHWRLQSGQSVELVGR